MDTNMAAPAAFQDGVFQLPVKYIAEDRFAAIDFGTSLLKVVYVAKEDREKLKSPDKEDLVTVHTAIFPSGQLDQALDLIAAKSFPEGGASSDLTFIGTGTETGHSVKAIQDKFGLRILMPMEFDAFVEGSYKVVTSISRRDAVCPLVEEAVTSGVDYCKALNNILTFVESLSRVVTYPIVRTGDTQFWQPEALKDDRPEVTYARAVDNLFPYMLVMTGSTCGTFEVTADGKADWMDVNQRGGRTFIGLGALLVGAQSHDELMALAEKGDNSTVDIMMKDGYEGNTNEAYAGFANTGNMVRAFFGKAYQASGEKYRSPLDTLKKEDVARAWVCMAATDLAQWVWLNAISRGLKRALVCGNLPRHPLFRYEMTASFNRLRSSYPMHQLEMEFLQNGGHIGALGALLCESHDKIPVVPAPQTK